jgi:thiol-disulfide isomerase/thioredoxin
MKVLDMVINSKDKIEYKFTKLALLIIAMALILTACSGNTQVSSTVKGSINVSNTVKMEDNLKNDFTLKDTKGKIFKLSTEKGKKVYIKFWATWCPICLGGIDELTKLSEEKANDKDTEIITIVSPGVKGEMSTAKFTSWFEKQGYNFRVLLDEGGIVAGKFGVRGYPTSVFIDTKGELAKTQVGQVGNNEINTTLTAIN